MEQTLHNAFKRFSLGDELRAYTFLGCHAAERDGVHGYVFRVWAPRAQGVSVTGDWNFWNTEDLPMTLVEYGIWEAFSAYAREGDAYKFYIRRRDGSAVYKSDPYAFRNCALPDTSSRICTLDGYTWGDADYRRKQGKRKLLNARISDDISDSSPHTGGGAAENSFFCRTAAHPLPPRAAGQSRQG